MKIEVIRKQFDDQCSIGELFIDGTFECYTLEDMTRPQDAEKVFGQTAIPYGTYDLAITFSNHFQRDLPLVCSVPNFEGVRIHPGNVAADTEGCLLVGDGYSTDSITSSRAAFDRIFPKIRDAIESGEKVTIEYKSGGVYGL